MDDIWYFPPQRSMKERLLWLTDVIRCRSAEQRIATRNTPRTELSFNYQFDENQVHIAQEISKVYGASTIKVPFWHELTAVAKLETGQTEVNIRTVGKRYVEGSYAFVIDGSNRFELVKVKSISSNRLTFESPGILYGYVNCHIMPCHVGHFNSSFNYEKFPAHYNTGEASFIFEQDFGIGNGNPFPSYLDSYVVTDRPIVDGSINDSSEREYTGFDSISGPIYYSEDYTYSISSSSLVWSFDSFEASLALRKWFNLVKGKQGSFYCARFTRDFTAQGGIATGDSAIVAHTRTRTLSNYVGPICVLLKTGQQYFFNVTAIESANSAMQRLILAQDSTVNIPAQSIELISVMTRMRLNSDIVEFNFKSGGSVDIRLPIMEVPQ